MKNALAFGLPGSTRRRSVSRWFRRRWAAGRFSAPHWNPRTGRVSVDFGDLTVPRRALSRGAGTRSGIHACRAICTLLRCSRRSLFGGGTAVLGLRNDGPDIMLGLDPYTLRQDLFVSLAGGPLTVGALSDPVELESAGLVNLMNSVRQQAGSPEPGPGRGYFWVAEYFFARFVGDTGAAFPRPPYDAKNQLFAIPQSTLILSIWQIGILPLKCRKSNHGVKKSTE